MVYRTLSGSAYHLPEVQVTSGVLHYQVCMIVMIWCYISETDDNIAKQVFLITKIVYLLIFDLSIILGFRS
jgi:hypothetical protein